MLKYRTIVVLCLLVMSGLNMVEVVADELILFRTGDVRLGFPLDSVDLVEWDRIDKPIVVSAASGAALPQAIADFRRCYEAMVGEPLRDTIEAGQPTLRLQMDPRLLENQGRQGYVLRVGENEVQIVAGSRLGLVNGLYSILDRWGCRWVMPGEIGEVIPERDVLSLPKGEHHAAFAMNGWLSSRYYGTNRVLDWVRRNRVGYDYWLTGQHYWLYAIPPQTYYKDHPEYYALIGGKRTPTQLCTTNPDVIELMIEKAKAYLRQNPASIAFPMDPADNLDFCQCNTCLAMDPPGHDHGQPLMTDRVIAFANHVAEAIAEEFPDRYVALYSYASHTRPPVYVKPRENVYVIVTRSNYCLLHLDSPRGHCDGSGPEEFMVLCKRGHSYAAKCRHMSMFRFHGRVNCQARCIWSVYIRSNGSTN